MSSTTDEEVLKRFAELLSEFYEGQESLAENLQFLVALGRGDTDAMIEAAGENTTTKYARKFLAVVKDKYAI
jgi:hypothetical protein